MTECDKHSHGKKYPCIVIRGAPAVYKVKYPEDKNISDALFFLFFE